MAIKSLLTNPADAIMEAKGKRNWGSTLLLLFSVVLILTLSAMLFSAYQQSQTRYRSYYYGSRPGVDVGTLLMTGAIVFVVSSIVLLFSGLLIKVATTTLGGVGGVLDGVTTEVFSLFAPAVGILLCTILMLAALSSPLVALILMPIALAILAYGLVLGYSTQYRCIKELFNTDMITAFVAASVKWSIFMAVFFLGMISSMMTSYYYMY